MPILQEISTHNDRANPLPLISTYSDAQLDASWGRGRPARKTATELVALPGKKNTFNYKSL